MRTKFGISALIVGFALIFLASCGSSGGFSDTTGWEYNSADNGGFQVAEAAEQITGPGLVFIEGGAFTMGRVEQDVMLNWDNLPRRVTVPSFYMDETEISNIAYREYLFWLKRVFVDYPEVHQKALPDTFVWRSPLAYNEPYVQYYLRHPAYNHYPVVGVSWLQADAYCSWRSDRVNEQILIDEGILTPDNPATAFGQDNFNTEAYLARKYAGSVKNSLTDAQGNDRPVQMEDGILLPRYQLPTEAQWEYAALAIIGNSIDERIYSRKLYPWNGHYLRNDSKEFMGQMRANYKRGSGDYMGVAGALNDNASITAPVDAYWPNDYGLYCMAGNVNEWVRDVYRPLSTTDMNDFRPFRGNVYMQVVRDEEGNIADVDSLGRLNYEPISPQSTYERFNYRRADNINYGDGDARSGINQLEWNSETETQGSDRMYYSGDGNKRLGITSLINDHARVYKGGSWKDMPYWLVPGTRRFLDEDKSTDDLGFRCSMIRVGSTSGF